ncbi:MAG: hypothetical protein PHX21_05335 [bacterium]|nr:hypothetical protein [bacterium]
MNHNTSMFVELMLRSLFQYNDISAFDLHITVLDNNSHDEHISALKLFMEERNIAFVQTGFDIGKRPTPAKHGEALSNFVLKNRNCTHYLFLDSDMWFIEKDTISTMLFELNKDLKCFAVQAKIFGFYAKRVIEGRDGYVDGNDVNKNYIFETKMVISNEETLSFPTVVPFRCSPVCSLMKNLPIFHKVVETFGLSPIFIYGVDKSRFYDTFGHMTHMMNTYGFHHIVSSKTINHFTETVNRPEYRGVRDKDCMRMLEELRKMQK